MKKILLSFFIGVMLIACNQKTVFVREVWTKEQANEWYKQWGWLRGCDFIPSTAINQMEMWQADTFDPVTIDRELGWAEDIGMNCMRVYLHHLVWETDKEGFKKRINEYLTYKGDTAVILPVLENYVKDILTTFKDDKRIVLWDLYNEPGGSGGYRYGERSLPLLQKIFTWGRTVNPSQPLSAGVWDMSLTNLNKFQLENSDVITYHTYEGLNSHQQLIDTLKQYGRPMICTEYMARTQNSTFQDIMPMLKKENIGAINWGLVAGKTNTIFAWDTPLPDVVEPPLWFHDIFRSDGTPYSAEEVECIRSLTK